MLTDDMTLLRAYARGDSQAADGWVMARDASIKEMVRAAYGENTGVSQYRTIVTTEFPTNLYDYFPNLRHGARLALQREIIRQFGLTARFETVATNVWLLRLTSHPLGLKTSNEPFGSTTYGGRGISAKKGTMDVMARELEETCQIPVMNQTGLTNYYDYDLHWYPTSEKSPGSPDLERISRVLTEQTGLELVPDTAPVEMLVVEKVK